MLLLELLLAIASHTDAAAGLWRCCCSLPLHTQMLLLKSGAMRARCEMPLPILVRQQSADVDSMWNAIAYTSVTNVDRCGPDVDSMWTRFPILLSILVPQMWTHTPFSIYNNKGNVGGESTWLHRNIVLGPRAS